MEVEDSFSGFDGIIPGVVMYVEAGQCYNSWVFVVDSCSLND